MQRPALLGALACGVLLFLGVAGYYLYTQINQPLPEQSAVDTPDTTPTFERTERVIGQSVEGRDIVAVTYGAGDSHLLFVGGIHGGYEWNSALLAYAVIDHFDEDPSRIPEDLTVTIIPDLNPDGTARVTATDGRFSRTDIADPSTRVAAGRFNANEVDLNRNFACNWAATSTWRGQTVSAGSEAFSEPEAVTLRDFVLANEPDAVVFWHAQANNVYASECNNGVLPETLTLMETYADAARYGKVESFDAYPITGDAEGWLASIGIPAITVELEGYETIEWERNIAGVNAVMSSYSIAK